MSKTNESTPLLRLIEEIYRTGSESHDWSGLVGQVAEYFGARSGTVGISDFSTGYADPVIHPFGLDEDILYQRWASEFGFENPWTEENDQILNGGIAIGSEIVPLPELRDIPLYTDVLKPLGIEDTMVSAISTSGTRVLFMALYRDRAHDLFDRHDRERLRPLVPHLVRASAVENMILDAGIRDQLHRAVFDEIEFAVFTIVQLKVEPMNQKAEELLSSGDGLIAEFGRLKAIDEDSDRILQESLVAAGAGLTPPSVATATPFPLRRGEGRLPLTSWAIPVSNRSESGLMKLVRTGGAMLFVGDPERRPELASETVARLFHLTPAEARLAVAIVRGETPREYAESQNLRENTVRWTLKQVQSKMGTRRQLDIASAIIRAIPKLRS